MRDKFWTMADTWFIVAILVGFILYEIVSGEASAGKFNYTPETSDIVFDVNLEIRANGELIDMGKLVCPKTSLPPGFDPQACPPGQECRVLPGTDNRKLRDESKKKYDGFVPSKKSHSVKGAKKK